MAEEHKVGGVDESTAIGRLDAILAQDPEFADEQPEEDSNREAQRQPAAEEAEPVQAQAEEPTEEDQAPEQSESEAEELDYDTLIQVKSKDASGNESFEDVPLRDLVEQRMLKADYTRKTSELARERAEVQEQLTKGLETERQQYVEALETQQQLIQQLLVPEVTNLDQLAEEDPGEYIKQSNRLQKINAVVQQIEARKQEAMQQQAQYWQQQVLPQQLEMVKAKIPDWSDDVKPTLIEAGKRYGFSDEEMAQVWDARQIHLLHDLARLQKLEKEQTSKKAVAAKKVVEKPKVVKAGKSQPERKGDDARKRLRKSGRWQDAVQYFYETDDM